MLQWATNRKRHGCVRIAQLALSSVLALSYYCPTTRGQTLEYRFQAVYLFNFLQFTQWPSQTFPQPDTPVIIGILGSDPFGGALDEAVRNEKIQGRRIVVKRFRRAGDIDLCHALYISKSEKEQVAPILLQLGRANILTVSDVAGFTEMGGAVEFFNEKGKLRFKVSIAAIKNADLKLGSQVLKLARIVGPEMDGREN